MLTMARNGWKVAAIILAVLLLATMCENFNEDCQYPTDACIK